MSVTVRRARSDDAAAIGDIYAPLVTDSAFTFDVEPPTIAGIRADMAATGGRLPWLVAERAGEVVGWARATPHNTRPAYRWAVNTSVYVRADVRSEGVGRLLYENLLEVLTRQAYVTAVALIVLPNDASVALHTAVGFEHRGVLREVGYKLGSWRDVGWWQRRLAVPAPEPPEPIVITELRSD